MITDWYVRKLPDEVRRELFLYVPRVTLVGMEVSRFKAVMYAYGQADLAHRVLRIMFTKGGRDYVAERAAVESARLRPCDRLDPLEKEGER